MSTKEIIEKYIAGYIANVTPQIEAEHNPEYRKNRESNLASHIAWASAVLTGKYVGNGTAHDQGINVEFRKHFATLAEAETEIKRFPKFLKARVGSTWLDNGANTAIFTVAIYASLTSSKVNGAANESGTKRIKRFLAIAGDFAWHNSYSKNFLSRETFESYLNQ